jgi:hypothetical protein
LKSDKAVAQQPFCAMAGSVELSFSLDLFCKTESNLILNPPHRKATRRWQKIYNQRSPKKKLEKL